MVPGCIIMAGCGCISMPACCAIRCCSCIVLPCLRIPTRSHPPPVAATHREFLEHGRNHRDPQDDRRLDPPRTKPSIRHARRICLRPFRDFWRSLFRSHQWRRCTRQRHAKKKVLWQDCTRCSATRFLPILSKSIPSANIATNDCDYFGSKDGSEGMMDGWMVRKDGRKEG